MRAYLEIAVRNMNLLCHKSINGQSFKVITEFLRNQKYPAVKNILFACRASILPSPSTFGGSLVFLTLGIVLIFHRRSSLTKQFMQNTVAVKVN